jgi:hypothetical protein
VGSSESLKENDEISAKAKIKRVRNKVIYLIDNSVKIE